MEALHPSLLYDETSGKPKRATKKNSATAKKRKLGLKGGNEITLSMHKET
tara:strand:- start:725 stop:874 length:150 start_codon:yes stop_codon:yes gene_type:complete